MDSVRFDILSRTLSTSPSRRIALRLLTGSALSLLGWHAVEDTTAHNALTACKKKSGKAKKKCLKKAKAHNATHTVAVSPPPPPGPCADGVRNGNESDIDCGGTCLRCVNDKFCGTRDDCQTALCTSGRCVSCTTDTSCNGDINGKCFCQQTANGGPKACISNAPSTLVSSCTLCPHGTPCIQLAVPPGGFACQKPCGAP